MKLLVFSESAGFRRQIEELLAPTSHQAESRGLSDMLAKGKAGGFDATLMDYQSWQRCASMFRYFDCLEAINQKPMVIFSKGRKTPPLKLRRAKTFTTNCPVPVQQDEFQTVLQQISAA